MVSFVLTGTQIFFLFANHPVLSCSLFRKSPLQISVATEETDDNEKERRKASLPAGSGCDDDQASGPPPLQDPDGKKP